MLTSSVVYVMFTRRRLIIGIFAFLVAMVATGAVGWRERWAAVALAGISIAWLVFDSTFEGPTLVSVDSTHGLTLGDLPALAGLVVAAVELRPRRR